MNTEEQLYVSGFNHGYLLTKYLPDLVAKLVTHLKNTTSEYITGFFSGKEEWELEMSRMHLKEIEGLRIKSHDKEHDREKE